MTISTLDGWIAAPKQHLPWKKTATRTTVALRWFSVFDIAGNPGAGTLAIGNTANGLVPTDATAGYPIINAFGGGAIGNIGRCEFNSSVACRIRLFDRVFAAGAYAFNANVSLASQPSYAGRMPSGIYNGTEIWVEQVTAATGNQAVNVTYLDQGGVSSSTGAVGIAAAPTVGSCWQLPLAAGDSGVQQINNVVGTVATAGTFNVMVLRSIASIRIKVANDGDIQDFLKTGMRHIFADSALYCLICPDSTSSGLPDCEFDVVNG